MHDLWFFSLCAHAQTKAGLKQTTRRPQTTARPWFGKLQLPAVRRMFVSLDTVQVQRLHFVEILLFK